MINPTVCPECGVTFTPSDHRQSYCLPSHQQRFNERNAIRGKVLVSIAQVSRQGKNGYTADRKYALQQFNALMDKWNREDRQAGRRPDVVVARKRAASWSAVDLASSDSPSPRVACGRDGAET